MAYTKLFASIITSTIWMEDNDTRIVWITMLAAADKNGEVQASVPGLARIAGVTLAACQAALEKFLAPDAHSRTKDDEGRRIEPIPGGWLLINHAKYRDLASRDESAAANAERQRRYRERQKRNGKSNAVTENVTVGLHIAEADTKADADADAEALNNNNNNVADSVFSMPPLNEFVNHYFAKMKKDDKGEHLPLVNWLHNQHTWCHDRWAAKPPKDWRNSAGAFTKRYVEYWYETQKTEGIF